MRLKSIKIFGFKSFPLCETLSLEGGIVALVGPNGCGKSNVVDAIRFAMAEQSPKSLRAEKLDDLLFGGNLKRKPLSLAEVFLTFDNIEELNLPYSELTVGRRISRDGRSEYLINGKSVRLKEVERLFLGSGIGKNSFCLFEQGKLDEIIRLPPRERRAIFEETAGVARFLEERKEALRRGEEMSKNYIRLSDTYEATKKKIFHLKEQAEAAKAYLEKKRREELLTKASYLFRIEEILLEDKGKGAKLDANFVSLKEIREKIRKLEDELFALREALKREREEIASFEKEITALDSLIKVKRVEEKKAEEKRAGQEVWEKSIQEEIASINSSLSQMKVEMKAKEKELASIQSEKEKQASVIREVLSQERFFDELNSELDSLRKGSLESQRELERAEYLSKEKRLSLDSKLKRESEILSRLQSKKEERAELEVSSSKMREEKVALDEKISSVKVESNKLTSDIKEICSNEVKLKEELSKINDELLKIEAKRRVLLDLQSEKAAFQLLKEASEKKSPLFGKLRSLKDVVKKLPKRYVETLLVEDDESLNTLLEVAKKKKGAYFSVALEKSLPSHFEEAGLPSLSDRELILDRNGIYFFIDRALKDASDEPEVLEKIRLLGEAKEKLSIDLSLIVQKRGQFERSKLEIDERMRKLETRHFEINFHLSAAQSQMQRLDRDLELDQKEREKIKKECSLHEKELESANEKILLLKKAKEEAQKLLTLKEEGQEKRREQSKENEEKRKCFSEISLREARLIEQKNHLSNEEKERVKLLSKKNEQLLSLKKEKEVTDEERRGLFLEIEMLSKKKGEGERKLKDLKERGISREKITQAEELLTQNQKQEKGLDGQKNQLERERMLLNYKREEREKEFQSRFSVPFTEVKITYPEGKVEEWEKEAAYLRGLLQKSSDLNFASIDELETEESAFNFLEREFFDLKAAKEDLEKLILTLERESRRRFQDTFEEVRRAFQKNFTLLFGGGFADLQLLSSDDPLTAGVEIVVEPPGQKLRQIALLSGGERCLAALALLFALFEIRPAPFCLMDEVDAPLDEANIERFTKLLSQFISKTQFLIVTHNKRTMSIADRLVGVTMEEKGVSKLISLEFAEAAAIVD